jgi:RNA polymerase sigma-70 factor (ECF subfamily)
MLDQPTLQDDELIALASTGDRDAFAAIVGRHAAAVLRLARAMSADDATAEDVVQETFLNAFRAAATYRPGVASVRTWLFAIARNEARRARRVREQPVAEVDDDSLLELGVEAGWGHELAEHALGRAEETELLASALASLGPDDREILVLRDLESLAGEAVAELVGLGLPAMKSRLHRARLRLLAALRASEGGIVENEREVAGLSCGAVLARLGDYVDGDTSSSEAAQIDAHLRGCSVCERFGGRYARVVHGARERLGVAPAVDEAQLERIRALLFAR